MQHFIKHSGAFKSSPTLLLLDNHTSHLSIEAIDLAAENGITMLTFPPHCSQRMQPLDVGVFGPIKDFYVKQCKAWTLSHAGKILEIQYLPGIIEKCLDMAVTPGNVKSGFKSTGISPFDPDIFIES